jgi:hypothetical protein
MPISTLTKGELIASVLAEIRKREGCEGVDSIAIQETRQPRSAANWEISIIAASRGDPSVVQRAAAAVQKHLQARYRLSGERVHRFQAGDRVRLSEIGRSRVPGKQTAVGTVGVERLRMAGDNVRVLFDGSKRSMRLHHSYIEPVGPRPD